MTSPEPSLLKFFRPSAWMVLHPFVVLLLIVVFIGLSHVLFFVQLSKIDILPNWCFLAIMSLHHCSAD